MLTTVFPPSFFCVTRANPGDLPLAAGSILTGLEVEAGEKRSNERRLVGCALPKGASVAARGTCRPERLGESSLREHRFSMDYALICDANRGPPTS